MSTTPRTISNVELRIQWTGDPGPFFSAEHDGFPGADVPTELVTLLRCMIGSTVPIDDANFKDGGSAALRKLFDTFVGVRGPGGNNRWSLTGAFNETRTSDGKKWQPGLAQEGLAFQLGVAELRPGMIMDPDAQTVPYSMSYKMDNPARVLAFGYWICFAFEAEVP